MLTRKTLGLALLPVLSALSTLAQDYSQLSRNNKPMTYYSLSGSCETWIEPDLAVISGGVTGSGLKPSDAVRQLEKQLSAITDYVQGQHGRLVLLERIRTLHQPNPNANNSSAENEQPAETVQHIHVELPPDGPIDAVLDRLIQLGMDRYGDTGLVNRSRQRAVVVHYRISNLRSLLLDMRHSCFEAAWKKQCAAENHPRACSDDSLPTRVNYQTFNVRSLEKLFRANGGSDFLRFTFSNDLLQNLDPPELAGNQPIKLVGDLTAQYAEEREQ